ALRSSAQTLPSSCRDHAPANYLDETRLLIEQADKDGVDRYAPKTLQKAEALLAKAETALTENRYDRDEPRSLARQAKYEAQHAIHLAKVLRPVRDRDMTMEEFALMTEEPIMKIASDLDMVAELDDGYDKPVGQITEKIAALQKDSYELQERLGQISDLELEIQSLDSQLGTQSSLLAAQEEQRQRFSEIEAMFGANEAELFTQGQDVIVRPIGLVFRSGSAQIDSQYFDILRKIQDAIRVFPESPVSIEGHTDSFGSDEVNLRISEERAEAVRQYLLANMRDVDPSMIDATGYGETNPVANNETADGRARNRRIDVVIRGTGRRTDVAQN
ncbi:MAG: OmpA family protein, partial [Pseudomonadota bacterium]